MKRLSRTMAKAPRTWVHAVPDATASEPDLSLPFPQGDDWEDDEAVEAVKSAIDISSKSTARGSIATAGSC